MLPEGLGTAHDNTSNATALLERDLQGVTDEYHGPILTHHDRPLEARQNIEYSSISNGCPTLSSSVTLPSQPSSAALKCTGCGLVFPSRTQLFKHLDIVGRGVAHAPTLPNPSQVSSSAGRTRLIFFYGHEKPDQTTTKKLRQLWDTIFSLPFPQNHSQLDPCGLASAVTVASFPSIALPDRISPAANSLPGFRFHHAVLAKVKNCDIARMCNRFNIEYMLPLSALAGDQDVSQLVAQLKKSQLLRDERHRQEQAGATVSSSETKDTIPSLFRKLKD
eukprot:UC4_evm1s1392